jgi:hypothetical protein
MSPAPDGQGSDLQRFTSVRFERALADGERDDIARLLSSVGATVTSWSVLPAFGRSYALAARGPAAGLPSMPGARVDEPPIVPLEIVPLHAGRLPALEVALGGRGRPAGVRECVRSGNSLLVELDESVTPLSFVVALVDVELEAAPGRRIVPLLGLGDESLADFASAMLREPDLDASRLIETYSEPLAAALES